MIYKVSEYRKGQVQKEFTVVGFRHAVRHGVRLVAREIEMNIVDLDKDCEMEASYISSREWSCTVTHRDEEVYGVTVKKDN